MLRPPAFGFAARTSGFCTKPRGPLYGLSKYIEVDLERKRECLAWGHVMRRALLKNY
jgi:hypothetical protein